MKSARGVKTLVLAAAAAFLPSGCASLAPQMSATPTQTSATPTRSGAVSTPTPVPVVSTIGMSGTRLMSATESGQPVATVDFAEGTDATVAFLTSALGAEPEQIPATDIEACSDVTARHAWGGEALVLDVWEPAGFVVTMREPSFNDIALQSSGEFSVGDNAQAFFDSLPPEQTFDDRNDASGPFVYDLVAAAAPWDEATPYGGVALLQPGGVVSAIAAPDTVRAFYC